MRRFTVAVCLLALAGLGCKKDAEPDESQDPGAMAAKDDVAPPSATDDGTGDPAAAKPTEDAAIPTKDASGSADDTTADAPPDPSAVPPASAKPAGFTNLKLLPKGISEAKLETTMKAWSSALGVECGYCHVSDEDFASDALPAKVGARKMVELTRSIHKQLGSDDVTCKTCHQGKKKPD